MSVRPDSRSLESHFPEKPLPENRPSEARSEAGAGPFRQTRSQPREALLNAPALLIMTAIVAVALYVLFPRQPAFRDPQNLRATDALSIAYLRVLVRSDPDNVPLRLSFVHLLTEAGANDEARAALAPLRALPDGSHAFEIALAEVRLNLQTLFLDPDAETAAELRQQLGAGFDRALRLAQSTAEQDALLTEAHKFGEPRALAALYEQLLARPENNGVRRGRLLTEIGRLHLAANEPHKAAQNFHHAVVLLTDKRAQRDTMLQALHAYLAAGDTGEALTAARQFVARLPADAELLLLAADIAQQNGDDAGARDYLVALRPLQPDDAALTDRLLRLELALGHLPEALLLARELAPAVEAGSERQRLLARTFDWNSQWQESLSQWLALALAAPDEESESRAFALAVGLAVDDAVIALIEAALPRRALKPNEADAYVSAGLRRAEPERLLSQLEPYLAREARDRAGWTALARLHTAAGAPAQALRAWQRAEQLSALTPRERLAIAEAYWQSGRAEPALISLLSLSSAPPAGQELRYWRLLAEISWSLERSAVVRPAYQQVLARFSPNDKLAIDRLFRLALQTGDRDAIERQAVYGWSHLKAREYFVVLLMLARDSGNTARLDALLAQAEQQGNLFAREPLYWQYHAERAMARQDWPRAHADLQQLAALRLNDPEVVEAILWWLLVEPTVDQVALNVLVERYETLASGNPIWAEVMAAAQHALGRPAEAAVWYQQTLPARKQDVPWLLTLADNLEWLGCTVTANQFRLGILQQLQALAPPLRPVEHPARLADAFFGRVHLQSALDELFPTDEDLPRYHDDNEALTEIINRWQLHGQLDNARLFALRRQFQRLQTDGWQDLAAHWQNGDKLAMATQLQALRAMLAVWPDGPLTGSLLPLSLNDVAGQGRNKKAAPTGPVSDGSQELAVCRQTLEQFSALAVKPPVPASAAASTNRSAMVNP